MKPKKIKTKLKVLRATFFIFFFLIGMSIVIGVSQAGKIKKDVASAEEQKIFSVIIPQDLTIVDEDYKDASLTTADVQSDDASTNGIAAYSSSLGTYASTPSTSGVANSLSQAEVQKSNSSEYAQAPSDFDTGSGYASTNDYSNRYNSTSSYGDRLAYIKEYLESSFNGGDSSTSAVSADTPSHVQRGRKSALFVSQGNMSIDTGAVLGGASQLANAISSGGGSLAQGALQLPDNRTSYDMQNSQKNKQDFLRQKQQSKADLQTRSDYIQLNTDYVLVSGSVIPIVLLTKINSDLPGYISARVVENVYDTFSGYNLLIPKGSLLVGSYDSEISWGQLRVLVVWETLTRPDGVSVALQGMQGVDVQGASGIISRVKTTIAESMAITVLSSLFKLGIEYTSAQAQRSTGNTSLSDATSNAGGEIVSTATELANKLLDRQPTLTVDPGTESFVFVHYDIELPAFE